MKGDVGGDEGQMAVITGTRKVMVKIAWLDQTSKKKLWKMKQPRSLIFLEEGLAVVQETDGSVWIRDQTR